MKIKLFLIAACSPVLLFSQKIFTQDVDNFWKTYDKIIKTKDSAQKLSLIQTMYIDKGTQGLHDIMKARRYSAQEYIDVIGKYPKFWSSIRSRTFKSKKQAKNVEKSITALKKIYPEAKPANTYFTVGLLRTNGTTMNGSLLIGTESAFADKDVDISEMDKSYPQLKAYFATNPIDSFPFLAAHEYIHTQQKSTIGNNLLTQAVMEGVAEFIASLSMNQKSPTPAIDYGYAHETEIKDVFVKEMFSPYTWNNWIWNATNNRFKMADLGYFVGYALVKKYYDKQADKKYAVKKMIELDYNNQAALWAFVEESGYFEKPVSYYKDEYEKNRPVVVGITEFENGSKNVNPNIKTLSVTFSQEMNPYRDGIDYGPLGKESFVKKKKFLKFTNNNKTVVYEIEVLPNTHHQMLFDGGFRSKDGNPAQNYLIDFTTTK
ncbi:hypothetical protein OZ664_11220 [Elizabethkingia sp. HX WHF]|uniref:hypothetical protein n=1 Tax=Elizabethkingia TaxID=308865 RepID=UPI00099B116E|nr:MULTISPECIES: hypothetical protein [Elizabethkingia]ATL43510.1 hypothetical protein CQS02_09450 [Elizabethkingia miricola]MCL1638399.1 hypothetical protein [Elizabethkingia bruuniana]MDX8564573.1 hypothetical protein [Elizabethkingia sp. HX WHF]OPC26353.1 hypothetical protein BAY00_03350 [Elizabethkingia bruuniana]